MSDNSTVCELEAMAHLSGDALPLENRWKLILSSCGTQKTISVKWDHQLQLGQRIKTMYNVHIHMYTYDTYSIIHIYIYNHIIWNSIIYIYKITLYDYKLIMCIYIYTYSILHNRRTNQVLFTVWAKSRRSTQAPRSRSPAGGTER